MNARSVAVFWKRVDTSERCWPWVGKLHPNGYGSVTVNGVQYAHRVAYTIANGAIPRRLHVLHRCDVPRCVRPSHLYVGTAKQNAADRAEARRRALAGLPPRALLAGADPADVALYERGRFRTRAELNESAWRESATDLGPLLAKLETFGTAEATRTEITWTMYRSMVSAYGPPPSGVLWPGVTDAAIHEVLTDEMAEAVG